jgi:putative endonuclease
MYYVYVLQSLEDSEFYTGFTIDLNHRIKEHNSRKGSSTKHRAPLKLVYFEWCISKKDAIAREKYLKTGKGKQYLRYRLNNYFEDVKIGHVL